MTQLEPHCLLTTRTPALPRPADASGGGPLPNETEVVPQQRKIPSGHYKVTPSKVTFVVPFAGEQEPLYLVTKGKMVGVFSSWYANFWFRFNR